MMFPSDCKVTITAMSGVNNSIVTGRSYVVQMFHVLWLVSKQLVYGSAQERQRQFIDKCSKITFKNSTVDQDSITLTIHAKYSSCTCVGNSQFRYLLSSLHVRYRITKFVTTPAFQVQHGILPAGVSSNSPSEPTMTQKDGITGWIVAPRGNHSFPSTSWLSYYSRKQNSPHFRSGLSQIKS